MTYRDQEISTTFLIPNLRVASGIASSFASADAFVVTDVTYRPRNPEESLLYQVVAGELETFLASQEAQDQTIPKFVEDEFRSSLNVGYWRTALSVFVTSPVEQGGAVLLTPVTPQ